MVCDNEIVFEDCTFTDNLARKITNGIYSLKTDNLTFYRCFFSLSDRSVNKRETESAIKGGFMQIIAESNVTIEDSTFSNG